MTLKELLEQVDFDGALGIYIEKDGHGELLDINAKTLLEYGDCKIGKIWANDRDEMYVNVKL